METAQDGNFVQKMETVDKNISEIKEKLAHLKRLESDIVSSLQQLRSEEKEYLENKEKEKMETITLKNEDPEVEYKRRLIERFTYKNTDMIQRIYAENQARAKQAHESLCHLNYKGEDLRLPLYNQPSELKIYNENIEKFKTFKPKLIKFLQMKRQGEIKVENHLNRTYENQKKMWLKKIERIDGNMKRRQRMNRARQFYEKEFPEIKKQREQQERFDRLGSRSIRSEAEFEEIANNLKEFEASQQHKKSLAIGTPKLLNTYDRRLRYINTNGIIRNLESFEKERKSNIVWKDEEKRIFREKFSQAPKDFEKISAALENKSCSDCVLFYYQNKKKEAFRSAKTKKKKTKAVGKGSIKADQNKGKSQNVVSSKPNEFNFDVEEFSYIDEDEDDDDDDYLGETGVETGVFNENTEPLLEEETSQYTPMETDETEEKGTENDLKSNVASTANEETGVGDDSITNVQNKIIKTPSKNGNNKPPQKVFLTRSKINKAINSDIKRPDTETESTASNSEPDQTQSEDSGSESSYPPLRMTIIVTSPSNVKEKATPPAPVASIISETVTQTSYFGETPPTQSIVSTVVPIEPSSEDLIRQHLNKMPEVNDPSRWSESEMIKAVNGLKRYGRSWVNIAKLVETKTENQCKNFYFNYKKKFNLEKILGIAKQEEKEDVKDPVPTKTSDNIDNKSDGIEDTKKKHENEKQPKQEGKGGKQETNPLPIRTTRTRSGKAKAGKNSNVNSTTLEPNVVKPTTTVATATTGTASVTSTTSSITTSASSDNNHHNPTVISTTLASIAAIGETTTVLEGTFVGPRIQTTNGTERRSKDEGVSDDTKGLPPPLLSQVDSNLKEVSLKPIHQQQYLPTSNADKTEQFSPIRGISLRDDLSRYERNIESLDEKKYLKSPMTQGEMPNFPTKATASTSIRTVPGQGEHNRNVPKHPNLHPAEHMDNILPKSRYDPLSAYSTSQRIDRPVGPRVERPMGYTEEEMFKAFSMHSKFAMYPDLPLQRMMYSANGKMTRFPASSSQSLPPSYPTSISSVRHSVDMAPGIRSKSPAPGVIKGPATESLMQLDEMSSKPSIMKGQLGTYHDDMEEKKRLFAQKIHEHGAMSAEKVKELAKSYFDNRSLRDSASPSQEEVQGMIQHHQYLRNLPRQPKSRSELTQRAASIPDLRTPHPDHRGELSAYHDKAEKRHYRTFDEEILLSKIPLTPLSRPGSADLDKSFWKAGSSKRSDLMHQANMAADIEAFKRKSSIVRPWEIDEQANKDRSSPFPSQRPSRSSAKSISPRPLSSAQQQQEQQSNPSFIHLSDSKKYKEEIIHFAQQNSPALETLSKFHFDEKSQKSPSSVGGPGNNAANFRGQRIASDQSLSPTFPLPQNAPGKPLSVPSSIATTISTRTRSDSEETVSADEEDQKHQETQQSIPSQTSSKVATPPPTSSSLLMQRLRCSAASESELEQQILKQAIKQSHSPIPQQQNPQMMQLSPHSTFSFPPHSQTHHISKPHQYLETQLHSPRDHPTPMRGPPVDEHQLSLHGLPPEDALLLRETLRQKKHEEEKQLLYMRQQEERIRREREEEMRRLIHLRKYDPSLSFHLKQAEEEEMKRRKIQIFEQKQKEHHKLQLAQIEEDRLKQHLQQQQQHIPTSIEEEIKYRMMFGDRRQPYGNENMMRLIEEEHIKQIRLRQMEEEERNRHFRALEEERIKQHMSLKQQQQQQQGHSKHSRLINTSAATVEEEKRLRQKLGDEKKQHQLRLKQLEDQQLQLRKAEVKKIDQESSSLYHKSSLQVPESMKSKQRAASPHPTVNVVMKRTGSYPKQLNSPLQQPLQQEFLQQQVEEAVRLKPVSPLSVIASPEIPSSLKNISPNLDSQLMAKKQMTMHTPLQPSVVPPKDDTNTNRQIDVLKDNRGEKPRLKFHEHFPEKQQEAKKENKLQQSPGQINGQPLSMIEDNLESFIQPPHVITQQLQDVINQKPGNEHFNSQATRIDEQSNNVKAMSNNGSARKDSLKATQIQHETQKELEQKSSEKLGLKTEITEEHSKPAEVIKKQEIKSSFSHTEASKLDEIPVIQDFVNRKIPNIGNPVKQPATELPKAINADVLDRTPVASSFPKKEESSSASSINSSTTDVALPATLGKSRSDSEKKEARPESPDIYDMNVPDEEDEEKMEKDKGFDLYENMMKPQVIDLKEIPKSDVELFYSKSPVEEDRREEKEVEKNIVETATEKQQSDEIGPTSDDTDGNEQHLESNRAGTPVMDEPSSASSKVSLPSLQLPEGGNQVGSDAQSLSSTPEAHTPLMDEPNEFNFEPLHTDAIGMDYLRFPNQPNYTMPPSATLYLSSANPVSQPQQQQNRKQKQSEAFESITPPSSPEHQGVGCPPQQVAQQDTSYFPVTTPAPSNPIAAFPFSALAINVGSRPSSRSGSSCQSPNATVSDHSPRSDLEQSGRDRLQQQQQQQNLLKRKRESSSDSGEHSKRSQKHSYRRSSQSSSTSSISKSPEYDFSKSKRN